MKLSYYSSVKKMGDKYRVSSLFLYSNEPKGIGKGKRYDEKLQNSISRARTKIFEYAYCNEWDYFITLTLDPTKYDRYDLQGFHKDLTQWLGNYFKNGRNSRKIRFLLVPEAHEKKLGESVPAWHIHGLIAGIDPNHLESFDEINKREKIPLRLLRKGFMNWGDYEKKFGFCSLAPIRSHEGVSKYITKYINKSLDERQKELGAHLYYCSRGLNHAEIIHTGQLEQWQFLPDYSNQHVAIRTYDTLEEAMALFAES